MNRKQKRYAVLITCSSSETFVRIRLEASRFQDLALMIFGNVSIELADYFFYNRHTRERYEAQLIDFPKLPAVIQKAGEVLK